ncbi:uncharacterized protein METZ01_LOCUS203026 [marine metagenome]|uniref:Uncharacterized protein n=1 Tax=marine metagenome TaxID=408172 RepID=A0A382EIL1_9ZZZZ
MPTISLVTFMQSVMFQLLFGLTKMTLLFDQMLESSVVILLLN